ncbi:MAG: 50S ribosomal protein L24 [SAR86 cluster bacterium]|uniref:Large ribosomal subunit protein uL24 n=1 Tax=SAR86 cluster bacterium TaxID=2030880 RepID=A0A368BNY2_9GAMM|nr:50S ribosomal protein L24 [Gammaproteobacteria bacterium]RCL38577.1 MAG: 50S ribosomal protein L24 [SAR86 cluster bacterium]|tara:strand:+ start:243 stop:581 length:339 start_codon:yes stop_codon:yes gene_type:complete
MKKNNQTITKLRTGDEVIVISGKDIGKKGTVQKISKFNNKAVISGINLMKKHTKPNPQLGEAGGIVEKEAAINLSNIAIWNPKQKKADRISFQTDGEKKLRVFTSDKKEIKS